MGLTYLTYWNTNHSVSKLAKVPEVKIMGCMITCTIGWISSILSPILISNCATLTPNCAIVKIVTHIISGFWKVLF